MPAVESAGRLAVVIPAYKPSGALVELVRALAEKSFAAIVVVDDGSGPEFSETFARVEAFSEVILLRHAVNLGKGAALRAGINHALCAMPNLAGVVTADADGQHHPDDIGRVAERLLAHPGSLVLGCRTFHQGDVPLRSRFGNILTGGVMHTLMGRKLSDTQTGLRGIPAAFALRILKLETAGYEFELEMLIAAHRFGVPLVEEPIRTIYEPGNQSSHFNPVVDSMKIYFVLLRFASVSLLTALLDGLIFYFTYRRTGNVLGSQALARLFALTFNYSLVRSSVFYSHQRHESVLPKYLLLVLASGTASYGGIRLLSDNLGFSPFSAKVVAETMLFLVNFAAQRLLIFKPQDSAAPVPAPALPPPPTSNPRLAALVSLVVVAVLGMETYGFTTGNLFSQTIWYPVGLQRFTRFIYMFGGIALALIAIVPWTFATLVVAFTAIGTVLAVGPQPLLAVAFFLISSCALGSRLLGTHGNKTGNETGDGLESQLFATLLGIGAWIFFMTFMVRLPANYPAVWAALLAIPILADLRGVGRRLARWWEALQMRERSEQAAFAVLVFFLLAHWFAALMPEHSADGLAMHLAIPMNIAANHRMTFEPALFVWSVMPMAADFTYSINYLLGGEAAAQLVNFAMLLALEALLYCAVRRWVSRTTAFLLMALFAATPVVQMVTGSLFVENLQAAMVLGMMTAIWRFGDAGERRYLYLAAALGGTSLAVKLGSFAFVGMGLPFVIWEVARHWKLLGAKPVLVCLLATVLLLGTGLPAYTIAYVKTGNPLFPFLGDRIVSPLLPADAGFVDERNHPPLTWNTLFDLTFHTSKLHTADGALGFQYLLLAPLSVVAILFLRRRSATSAAVVAIGACIVTLRLQPDFRYLYACLLLVTVAFAAVVGWAADRRWLFRALIVFIFASIVANGYFLPSASYYHKDFSVRQAFSRADHERYLTESVPIRAVIAHYNRAHPNSAVLSADSTDVAGLQGAVYENTWHQYNTYNAILHARSVPAMIQLMQSWKVEYFISFKPEPGRDLQPAALSEMLEHCTEAEFEAGNRYLAHLEPTCHPRPDRPPVVVSAGFYDDYDPGLIYRGAWTKSADYDGPDRHTITQSNVPGAEVQIAFEGKSLIYECTKAPNRGVAEVIIDGVSRDAVDLYAPSDQWQTPLRFAVSTGRHVAVIRVAGRADPRSTGQYIDLDSFTVQ